MSMLNTSKAIKVLAEGLCFPEGPAFAADGSLWIVELKGESLIQYQDNKFKRFLVGGKPNGIAINAGGEIWFCDAGNNTIRKFHPDTEIAETIVEHVNNEVLFGPNDLAFDNKGNLLFTCPGNSRQEPTGYICVLQANGLLKKITVGKYFPNGLAFRDDGKILIYAETYRHRLWIADWNDKTCELSNERVWCNIGGPPGPGGPDGMAFHPDGNLYVAVFGTWKIKVVNTHGSVINEILLPGMNPTNCAFNLQDELHLIVTEAERGELLSLTGFE